MAGGPTPLFVLGKHRSGTKWLANQIGQHPEVAGIFREDGKGIIESKVFARVRERFDDLTNLKEFNEFVQVFGNSDYFQRTGLSHEDLYEFFPGTLSSVFRAVMDHVAEAQGARYWMEKTPEHTPMGPWLQEVYPDARFVGIVRDRVPVVASHLGWVERDPGLARWRAWTYRIVDIVRLTQMHHFYNRVLTAMDRRSDRVLLVSFAGMKADTEAVMREVAAFLELPFDEQMLVSPYPQHSSFSSSKQRDRELSRLERGLVHATAGLCRMLPRGLHRVIHARTTPERKPLPHWYYQDSSELAWEQP